MRNRRALSTVVGAVFFVIAMGTTIAYVSYSMNAIDDFAQSVIVAESLNIDRGNEEIEISSVTIDGGKFNVTVVNTGSLSAHLTRLWVTNEDLSPPTNEKGNLDVIINTGNQVTNIGQSLGINADTSTSYTLKAVTERGNVATFLVSPDVSTRIKVLAPGSVINDEKISVSVMILNNSTLPNNIVDLNATLSNNATLTPVSPHPAIIKTLKDGDIATFTWEFQAPLVAQVISFNGSYNGAPLGAFDTATTEIYSVSESQSSTSSQWSEKARKVGILISGIPSPIDAGNNAGLGKFGIGIINPLDRNVEIYAIAVNAFTQDVFDEVPIGLEPSGIGVWGFTKQSDHALFYWQAGTGPPHIIPPKSIGQFRVITDISGGNLKLYEQPLMIEALTSEGKMTITYNIAVHSSFPTVNVFYTTDPNDPLGASNENWGYQINNVKSGTWKIFNATVENTSFNGLTPSSARVAMTILIPRDFTVNEVIPNPDFNIIGIIPNPDGSTFIKVNSTASLGNTEPYHITLQFNATAPEVSDDSLYVFQTTTFFPGWDGGPQITSSLSEAGVEVVP